MGWNIKAQAHHTPFRVADHTHIHIMCSHCQPTRRKMPHCICRFLRHDLCIEGFDVWSLTSSTAQEKEVTHVSVSCLVCFEIGSALFPKFLSVRCFRAAWPSHFERTPGHERVRASLSNHINRPRRSPAGGLERPFRAPQRRRSCSKSETWAGAVFSSSQAGPAQRPFRAPQRSRAGSMSKTSASAVFPRQGRAEPS